MKMAKKKMSGYDKLLVLVIIPNLLLVIAIVWVFLLVSEDAAWWLSLLGTPGIYIADIIYIVFFDSKSRWPGLTARQRAVKLMTYQR